MYLCVRMWNLWERRTRALTCKLNLSNHNEWKLIHQSFEPNKSQATKEKSLLTVQMVGFVVSINWPDLKERAFCSLCFQINCTECEYTLNINEYAAKVWIFSRLPFRRNLLMSHDNWMQSLIMYSFKGRCAGENYHNKSHGLPGQSSARKGSFAPKEMMAFWNTTNAFTTLCTLP